MTAWHWIWVAAGLMADGILTAAGGVALSAIPARRAASHRTRAHRNAP
jgi:hypothetical protein